MSDEQTRAEAAWLSAFADPTRLRIAYILAGGELHVGAVVAAVGVPLPNVSHHLRLMHRAGALTTRRDGRHIFYALVGAVVSGGAVALSAHGVTFTLRLDGPVAELEKKPKGKKG